MAGSSYRYRGVWHNSILVSLSPFCSTNRHQDSTNVLFVEKGFLKINLTIFPNWVSLS